MSDVEREQLKFHLRRRFESEGRAVLIRIRQWCDEFEAKLRPDAVLDDDQLIAYLRAIGEDITISVNGCGVETDWSQDWAFRIRDRSCERRSTMDDVLAELKSELEVPLRRFK